MGDPQLTVSGEAFNLFLISLYILMPIWQNRTRIILCIFSRDWKEEGHLCYELVDVLFFFCITGDTNQTRISKSVPQKELKILYLGMQESRLWEFGSLAILSNKWRYDRTIEEDHGFYLAYITLSYYPVHIITFYVKFIYESFAILDNECSKTRSFTVYNLQNNSRV